VNRIRTRLLLVFLAATLVPVGMTLWITSRLLERSISLNRTRELDATSQALEQTGRALYLQSCDALRAEVAGGGLSPSARWRREMRPDWPADMREFDERGVTEQFSLAGERQDRLQYLVRSGRDILVYTKPIGGPGMKTLSEQFARARTLVERADTRDLRRGFVLTLVVLAVAVWAISFVVVLYLSRRISRPMEQLTAGLSRLASGDLGVRLEPQGRDEVGEAMLAFNHTAGQLQESRDKLVHVTRLASWQTLARKMAHEVKNSLTPIRLTMEEAVARHGERDEAFIEQAAQIVVDEVSTLERRVRAFTEFASEPPVNTECVDINSLLQERIALLRAAHPEVEYDTRLDPGPVFAKADADLVKGVLTNLLENAAQAAGRGGIVRGRTMAMNGKVAVEIEDSGPGLSAQARATLFEPTISFKKSGLGLGLSIAKRSALLLGGDLLLAEGELGGAAFRVLLPRVEGDAGTASTGS
jgi:nitrogen fixation/metabolism regulation signal transduction histidine kinase